MPAPCSREQTYIEPQRRNKFRIVTKGQRGGSMLTIKTDDLYSTWRLLHIAL